MKNIHLLVFLIFVSSSNLVVGTPLNADSLLEQRRIKYDTYLQFRNTMGQRTWINLVNLNNKAYEILKQDDWIIGILNSERNRISKLTAENDKLQLEIGILKKEAKIQEMLINDKKYYANIYLGIIGFLTLLFFAMLILFIDRQARFRSIKLELERIWTSGEHKKTGMDNEEISLLKQQQLMMESERDRLKSANESLRNDVAIKEQELKKAIEAKNRIESEIRTLINQLKQKSST